jgi:indolepyruvate ferredoxin oxidoreductase beta subunit
MKTDIILAGVGGQGILSIAAVIGMAAVNNNLYLKQAEVHGMSQRGGDVQSNLRVSDKPIASDLIPHRGADLILSVEPMEALRYLPYLSDNGWVVTNTTPFNNISNYPDEGELKAAINSLPRHIALDADKVVKDLGSPRSSNMVILGASSPFINIASEELEKAIVKVFEQKGTAIVESNLNAFRVGRDFTQKNQ